jgi:hypothetical protein
LKLSHASAVDGERPGFDRIIPVSCRLRRHLESSVAMRSEPGVGQEFAKPAGGLGREATEDVGEVGEPVDVVVPNGF